MTSINSYNPYILHRHSIRLKNYDYSQPGAYFVTITAYQRALLFGEIKEQRMLTNQYGEITNSCWEGIPSHYTNVLLDSFIIMPNHVHGIIFITNSAGAGLKPAPTTTDHPLSEIIRAFKTFSARRINKIRAMPGISVWQRNYYEHIIRNEKELASIREYIINNVIEWESDRERPDISDEESIR